jgi:hypothetical protein
MAAKLTRLTDKIAIQLHLVVTNFTICISRSRRPVRKLLDILSHVNFQLYVSNCAPGNVLRAVIDVSGAVLRSETLLSD